MPLPFAATQESTFALGDCIGTHTSCPGESLRKRKFIMHVSVSADEGDDRYGNTIIICEGSPRGRRKPYEPLTYELRVLVHFQKKEWAYTMTTIEIAKELVQQAHVKHVDTWKLMTLENLPAHCASEEKQICRKGKVLLCFHQYKRRNLHKR